MSWQVYVNNDIDSNWLGDFSDNLLRNFAAFNPVNANDENTVPRKGLLARANVLETHTTPPADVTNGPSALDYVLKDFIADCASGSLPEISWVVGPYLWTEHGDASPNYGAIYVDRVVKAVYANPELQDSTLIILNYDEYGSYYDHVTRPVPEMGTPDEYTAGLAPGLGCRTPTVLISPWTRGGWVASETFDHTSVIQFMEKWTTFPRRLATCPNISAWRRSICGDLTSAIDFSHFDNSLPDLPAPEDLATVVERTGRFPTSSRPLPASRHSRPSRRSRRKEPSSCGRCPTSRTPRSPSTGRRASSRRP